MQSEAYVFASKEFDDNFEQNPYHNFMHQRKCADNLALQFKIVFIGRKKCVHIDMSKSLNQRRLGLEKDGTRYQLSLPVVLRNEIHDISIFLNDITKRHQSFK